MLAADWRFVRLFLCSLGLLGLLGFSAPPARTQQPLVDAAEISRALLSHPARLIESAWAGAELRFAVFRAAEFTYRLDGAEGQWQVTRQKNDQVAAAIAPRKAYRSERLGAEYRFAAASTDDEGILEIRTGAELLARLRLWESKQLTATWLAVLRQETPSLTAEALAKDLEIADPEVAGVADDGAYFWLAIRYSAAEGALGIGTLLRFDPKTNDAKIFQPAESATASLTHIVSLAGALWLGTLRPGDGAVFPAKGLVRFDPASGEVRSHLPGPSRLLGSIVTALEGHGGALLVATDAGMCRIEDAGGSGESWTCWRIVPTVRLTAPTPVSNRPGAPPGGQLPAGSYEVLWANTAFFEVVTADWMEGWVRAEDFEEYARLHFEAEPYELGNSGGGPGPMRVLAKPDADPLQGAQVYRAPLERVGVPTAAGWQRVRARVGWIPRDTLEVAPVIQRAASPAKP